MTKPGSVVRRIRDVQVLGELRASPDEAALLTGTARRMVHRLPEPELLLSRGSDSYRFRPTAELVMCACAVLMKALDRRRGLRACAAAQPYVLANHAPAFLVRATDSWCGTAGASIGVARLLAIAVDLVFSGLTGARGGVLADLPEVGIDSLRTSAPPRAHVDGDRYVMTAVAVAVRPPSVPAAVVGALLGRGASRAAPAVSASLWGAALHLVTSSYYDRPTMEFAPLTFAAGRAALVPDDNIGTGTALRRVAQHLRRQSTREAGLRVMEIHWKRIVRTRVFGRHGATAALDELQALSPWCLRHGRIVGPLMHRRRCQPDLYEGYTLADWAQYSSPAVRLPEAMTSATPSRAAADPFLDAVEAAGVSDWAAPGALAAIVNASPCGQASA